VFQSEEGDQILPYFVRSVSQVLIELVIAIVEPTLSI